MKKIGRTLICNKYIEFSCKKDTLMMIYKKLMTKFKTLLRLHFKKYMTTQVNK